MKIQEGHELKFYYLTRTLLKKMVENQQSDQLQPLIADLNTRLQDLEGKNGALKDRTLLLGENLISNKEKLEEELLELKRQMKDLEKRLEDKEKILRNLVPETDKMIRRDEMILIEKMLKDFQPLEFMRKKDVEELIEQKLIKERNTTK